MKRMAIGRIFVAIVLGLMGVGTLAVITAAAQSLPGQDSNPVKKVFEKLQNVLTTEQTNLQEGSEISAQDAVNQSKAAPHLGQNTNLKFKDVVQSISGETWKIGAVDVSVISTTVVIGNPVAGSMVNVWASEKEDGSVTALKIVETDRGRKFEVSPTPSPTPTVTATVTATATTTATEIISVTEGLGLNGMGVKTPKPPGLKNGHTTHTNNGHQNKPGDINRPDSPGNSSNKRNGGH